METLDIHIQIGHLVAERPARSRIFDRYGLDYCCGGKRTVEDACRRRGIDPDPVLAELEALDAEVVPQDDPIAGMSMTELADHIEETHHAYLRSELPRLARLVDKVTAVHGEAHAWLEEVRTVYVGLVAELEPHMDAELCHRALLEAHLLVLRFLTANRRGAADGYDARQHKQSANRFRQVA